MCSQYGSRNHTVLSLIAKKNTVVQIITKMNNFINKKNQFLKQLQVYLKKTVLCTSEETLQGKSFAKYFYFPKHLPKAVGMLFLKIKKKTKDNMV